VFLPGINVAAIVFILVITVSLWFRPELGPAGPCEQAGRKKAKPCLGAGRLLLVILLTIGGIYGDYSPV